MPEIMDIFTLKRLMHSRCSWIFNMLRRGCLIMPKLLEVNKYASTILGELFLNILEELMVEINTLERTSLQCKKKIYYYPKTNYYWYICIIFCRLGKATASSPKLLELISSPTLALQMMLRSYRHQA